MRISELSRRPGVSARAIGLYESRGLIRAGPADGGYRVFTPADVRGLVFIRMGCELGLSLTQIGDWVPAYRSGRMRHGQPIDGLQQRVAEIDRELQRLKLLREKTTDHIAWARDRQAQAHSLASPAPPAPAAAAAGGKARRNRGATAA